MEAEGRIARAEIRVGEAAKRPRGGRGISEEGPHVRHNATAVAHQLHVGCIEESELSGGGDLEAKRKRKKGERTITVNRHTKKANLLHADASASK
jgi:hypothetical protein